MTEKGFVNFRVLSHVVSGTYYKKFGNLDKSNTPKDIPHFSIVPYDATPTLILSISAL